MAGASGAEDKGPFVEALLWWVGAYVALIAAMTVLRYFQTATLNKTGQAVVHDLRAAVFRHLQSLDLGFFDRRPTGALVTRVTTDIESLSEMFTSGIIALLFDSLKVLVVLGMLFAIDVDLALITMLTTPILIGVSLAFRGGARRAHREVRARLARLNGYLQEVLGGIRVVQVFRREERVAARFNEALARYFEANRRTIFLFALFYPVMSLAVYLIQGAALWAGIGSIVGKGLTYGEFVQFWLLLNMLVRPIRELGERYNVLQSAFASAERIFQVSTPPASAASSGPARHRGQPSIRFEDVEFEYVEGRLSAGSPSRSCAERRSRWSAPRAGKSTLVNLLLRFYDPQAGRITLDDVGSRTSPDLARASGSCCRGLPVRRFGPGQPGHGARGRDGRVPRRGAHGLPGAGPRPAARRGPGRGGRRARGHLLHGRASAPRDHPRPAARPDIGCSTRPPPPWTAAPSTASSARRSPARGAQRPGHRPPPLHHPRRG